MVSGRTRERSVQVTARPRAGACRRSARASSEWSHLMREDLAAVNVTRSYTLAGTNIAIFTFMLFFLYPRFESGRINPMLFQATLIAMGVATFSLVFATLHYYRCSLGGWMSDTERTLQARRADRFWLLGYNTMFLAARLVLFLLGLSIVASVWLAFWLFYLFFVVRYFPRLQTPLAAK